jgi:hypothetical protein
MTMPPNAQPFQFGVPNIGMSPDIGRYVNSVGIQTSQWDVSVDFYHQFGFAGPSGQQRAQQIVCKTVMSPMHAKALVRVLQLAVDQWEEKFGALPSADVLMSQTQSEGEENRG